MTTMTNFKHPQVDAYIQALDRWKAETSAMREILLDCGLTEDWKWRQPCYTFDGTNQIILGNFKDSAVMSFLNGSLLEDPEGWLVRPGEHSMSVRFLRFTDADDIRIKADRIKAFVRETIRHAQAGRKVENRPEDTHIPIPQELLIRFQEDPAFEHSFHTLTSGRQRAYLIFFTATKTPSTRFTRIDKYRSRILEGKGMNDCVCGMSKRMPGCDGSHRQLNTS